GEICAIFIVKPDLVGEQPNLAHRFVEAAGARRQRLRSRRFSALNDLTVTSPKCSRRKRQRRRSGRRESASADAGEDWEQARSARVEGCSPHARRGFTVWKRANEIRNQKSKRSSCISRLSRSIMMGLWLIAAKSRKKRYTR